MTFAWDGGTRLARQLQVTSFDNVGMDAIRSCGVIQTHEAEFSESVVVQFEPTSVGSTNMLLLPFSSYIMLPDKLLEHASFGIEFGVLLEPGESYGWKGLQGQVGSRLQQEEMSDGQGPPGMIDVTGGDSAQRLVRIQRLYDSEGKFSSGATSLCTLE